MNGGSSRRVRSRASFCSAIAPNAVLALETALESSLPRWATAVAELGGADDEAFEQVLVGVQLADEGACRLSDGPKYLKVALACLPRPENCSALPRMNWPSARRTGVGKVLRTGRGRPRSSSSRGRGWRRRRAPGLLFGPGLSET
jgi:hypothetical protein